MNKKNLSVVLAGAMLASTVAPVLAETTLSNEYTTEQLNVLRKDLTAKLKEKEISTYAAIKDKLVSDEVKTLMDVDKSAYGIKVLDKDGKELDLVKLGATNSSKTTGSKINDVTYDINDVALIFADANASKVADCSVQIVERTTSTFKGQIIPGSEITKKENTELVYDIEKDFSVANGGDAIFDAGDTLYTELGVGTNKYINKIEGIGKSFNAKGEEQSTVNAKDYFKSVKVVTNTPKDLNDVDGEKVAITLNETSKRIDPTLPLDEKGNVLDYTATKDITKFKNFETKSEWNKSEEITDAPKVVSTVKVVPVEEADNTIKAEDLYDGVVLTAKGTELAAELANAKENASAAGKELVKISAAPQNSSAVNKFHIFYYKNEAEAAKDTNLDGKEAYKFVTVYSSNFNEIKALHSLLSPASGTSSYKVGIIGGENRYETAVNIAKEQNTTVAKNGNIVLVNGASLVDGLSAAPLAASLANKTPILLTKSDSLPEETKEYIKELTKNLNSTDKKTVKVNLVGGTSVLSSSLVKEIESMGLTVKRFGGANREATSLAVAKHLKATGDTNAAFVVGGNGEADAMAISAVAAKNTTPIIVSSVHGLSEDALEYLKEKSAKGNVTIIGGESVVSKAEEEAINDSLSLNKASRIAGENRFETNAKIIEEYYKLIDGVEDTDKTTKNKGVEAVIVAKDGQANKGDLVDALAAANYAASKNAPIVLATNSLSAVQKNALLKVDKTKGEGSSLSNSLTKAVQVGNGVERSVLETVAGLFGLSNK